MLQTLTVSSPAIPDLLEPVRLWGMEGVNALFEYELLFKTPDALNFSFGATADTHDGQRHAGGLMKQAQLGLGSSFKGTALAQGSGQSMGSALTTDAVARLPPGVSLVRNLS